MKTIKVKTIFNNKVAFPEKYYNQNSFVMVGEKMMSLKDKKPVGYSEYLDDKFGREKYRLIYFEWIPEDRQIKLFKPRKTKKQKAWDKYNSLSEEQKKKLIFY